MAVLRPSLGQRGLPAHDGGRHEASPRPCAAPYWAAGTWSRWRSLPRECRVMTRPPEPSAHGRPAPAASPLSAAHNSRVSGAACQNDGVAEVSAGLDGIAARVARELAECRQRGLDWLDRRTHNQQPVRAAVLQQLASDYVTVRGIQLRGRGAQIKRLLRDALAAYSAQDNEADAQLITDLFFGDPQDAGLRAGQLLDRARVKWGNPDVAWFREKRNAVFREFAEYLVGFGAAPAAAAALPPLPPLPLLPLRAPRILCRRPRPRSPCTRHHSLNAGPGRGRGWKRC